MPEIVKGELTMATASGQKPSEGKTDGFTLSQIRCSCLGQVKSRRRVAELGWDVGRSLFFC